MAASSEALQMMADRLLIPQAQKNQAPDYRTMLTERYPCGLINDAELEALLGILNN